MAPPDPTSTEKARLRAEARAGRQALGAAARAAASARITERCLALERVATASSAFVYVSTPEEVSTRDLIDRLRARDCTVLVPSIVERIMRAVPFPGWDRLQPGALGIPSPPPAAAHAGPVDVALVPGLAFTPGGLRLGYGGGYYDRWLADHPATASVALAFRCQVVDALPVEAWDAPVDLVLSEDGPDGQPGSSR